VSEPLTDEERKELVRLLQKAALSARSAGQETLDDQLSEAISYVVGWCSPHMRIPT
jgi:hypothetical protein